MGHFIASITHSDAFYSPVNRNVRKTLHLAFNKDTEKVKNITLEFFGMCSVYYNEVYYDHRIIWVDGKPRRERLKRTRQHTNVYRYFSQQVVLLDGYSFGSSVRTIKNGEKFDFPVDFEFPNTLLPSSCPNFGSGAGDEGYINVVYGLNLKVERDKFMHGTLQESFTLMYQSGFSVLESPQPPIRCHDEYLFKGKLKEFVLDEDSGQMVENSLKKAHRHTRGIRKLWNSDYKRESYNNLARDIKLITELESSSFINLDRSPSEIGFLRFIAPAIGDLEPHFRYGKQSTGLGGFKIKNIGIFLNSEVEVRVNSFFSVNRAPVQKLYSKRFENGEEFVVDIADFIQDGESYYLNVPLEQLIDSDKAIMDFLQRPVMPTIELGNYFKSRTSISVVVTVASNSKNDMMEKEYQCGFGANVSFNKIAGNPEAGTSYLPQDVKTGDPPPVYSVSELD